MEAPFGMGGPGMGPGPQGPSVMPGNYAHQGEGYPPMDYGGGQPGGPDLGVFPPNGAGRGRGDGGGRGKPWQQEGDWPCPNPSCTNINFAFRGECNRCSTARPPGAGGTGSGGRGGVPAGRGRGRADAGRGRGGPPGLFGPNDWACPMCGNMNWAKRNKCNICSTNRPGFSESGPREGRAGGYKEFDEAEIQETKRRRKEQEEDDGEMYDEFGTLKKKYRKKVEAPAAAAPQAGKAGWEMEDIKGDRQKADRSGNGNQWDGDKTGYDDRERSRSGQRSREERDSNRDYDRTADRGRDSDRRDRDAGRSREYARDYNGERDRDQYRDGDRDGSRERGRDRDQDYDRSRERSRDNGDYGRGRDRDRERGREQDRVHPPERRRERERDRFD